MNTTSLDTLIAQALRYNPDTGDLWWRQRGRGRRLGKPAGFIHCNGYRRINIGGKFLFSHRIAWFLTNGVWPSGQIDHINGIRDDNRLVNLRDVEPFVNSQNQRKPQKGNKTGYLGVSRKGNRWRAHITVDGKRRCLGYFLTPEEAGSAYIEAKRSLHEGNTL